MPPFSSDIAFTPAVKAVQARLGSRDAYARVEAGRGFRTAVTPDRAGFLAALDMFYLANATAGGQPYIQYRGGPQGFLKVLDSSTLAAADFGGNRQYISAGNLSENPRVALFLMDYSAGRRVKVWGTARVVEGDAGLTARVADPAYPAAVERVMVITVAAWDANCPQHIHKRFAQADIGPVVEGLQRRIAELEAEVARLSSPGRSE